MIARQLPYSDGPKEGGVLRDVLDAADEFLMLTAVDCEVSPAGHDTACQCETHLRVRVAAGRLEALIEKARKS